MSVEETVRSYDRDAAAHVASTAAMTDEVRVRVEALAAQVGPGGRVLEIGSGGGRDALAMEGLGVHVRRTDITPGFVELLRSEGHECDGDGWSTHGSISSPRHFTYWRADALSEVVAGSGSTDVLVRSGIAGHLGESWLEVSAVRDSVSP